MEIKIYKENLIKYISLGVLSLVTCSVVGLKTTNNVYASSTYSNTYSSSQEKNSRELLDDANTFPIKNFIDKINSYSFIIGNDIVDHTKQTCITTRVLNSLEKNKDNIPLGIKLHQIPKMYQEYQNEGKKEIIINYVTEGVDYRVENVVLYAKPFLSEEGQRFYRVPKELLEHTGWQVTSENGIINIKRKFNFLNKDNKVSNVIQFREKDSNNLEFFNPREQIEDVVFYGPSLEEEEARKNAYPFSEKELVDDGWIITSNQDGQDKLERLTKVGININYYDALKTSYSFNGEEKQEVLALKK